MFDLAEKYVIILPNQYDVMKETGNPRVGVLPNQFDVVKQTGNPREYVNRNCFNF